MGVPDRTWARWVQQAKAIYISTGGDVDEERNEQLKPPPPKPHKKAAPEPPQRGKAMPRPMEGEVLTPPKPPPSNESDPTAPPPEVTGLGVRRGDSYVVVSMFGAKESTVVKRWSDPPDPTAPMPVVDQYKALIHSADAVLHSVIKKVGDAHAILDPNVAVQAIETQRKAVDSLIKAYEKMHNVAALEQFLENVVGIIKRIAPDQARVLIQALREAMMPYSSKQWPSPQPAPL